jgi:hypothetical protein
LQGENYKKDSKPIERGWGVMTIKIILAYKYDPLIFFLSWENVLCHDFYITYIWTSIMTIFNLDLGIKPEPETLNPKYPNPYPFSPKFVTQIVPAGNEIDYPNLVRA